MGLRSDSLFSFAINNQGGWETDQYGVYSETIPKENVWYHIVGTWDGTYQKIYINGKLENIASPQVLIGNFDSNLYIGAYGGNIPQYAINGTIDDIRIYDRALSAEEIYQLYTDYITVDFTADTTSGAAPLTVHFSDRTSSVDSSLKINSWEWDFANDGQIDSQEQNPEWTYNVRGSIQ